MIQFVSLWHAQNLLKHPLVPLRVWLQHVRTNTTTRLTFSVRDLQVRSCDKLVYKWIRVDSSCFHTAPGATALFCSLFAPLQCSLAPVQRSRFTQTRSTASTKVKVSILTTLSFVITTLISTILRSFWIQILGSALVT